MLRWLKAIAAKGIVLLHLKKLSSGCWSERLPGRSAKLTYAQRVKAGIILATLLVSLINVGLFARKNHAIGFVPGKDVVSLSETRFEGLKQLLPGHGMVGYVSDVMPSVGPITHRDEFSDEKYEIEYALTQYSLSPLVVDFRTEGHDLVVGNFRDASKSQEIATAKGLVLIRDFGNGIMLFSRAGDR